jgi:hypothetical protein
MPKQVTITAVVEDDITDNDDEFLYNLHDVLQKHDIGVIYVEDYVVSEENYVIPSSEASYPPDLAAFREED